MKRLFLVLVLALWAASLSAATRYASTTGSGSSCTAIGTPCLIGVAISQGVSGDTIELRAGTHLTSAGAQFVPAAGVTIRSYPGEWAKVDGNGGSVTETFKIVNSDVTLRDFEIFNSLTPRVAYNRASGVAVQVGSNVKLINLVIHDTGQGIFIAQATPNLLVYGCLIYNAGTGSLDHTMYAQNNTGVLHNYEQNVLLRSAAFGFHGFGSSAIVNDMKLFRNVCADAGAIDPTGNSTYRKPCWFAGGPAPTPVTRITFEENLAYHKPGTRASGSVAYGIGLNYGNQNYGTLTVKNNYTAGGWRTTGFQDTQSLTATGNTTITDTGQVIEVDDGNNPGWNINNNTYYVPAGSSSFSTGAKDGAGNRMTFAAWKTATGYDAASTSTSGVPAAAKVFVWTNAYEPGRGLVTIFNWPGSSTVAVDLSAVLANGASYAIRDNQNFDTVVATGTYSGGTVSFTMTGTAATPIGLSNPGHLGPLFGTFTVKTTAGGGPTPSNTPTATGSSTATATRTPTNTPIPPTPTVTPSSTGWYWQAEGGTQVAPMAQTADAGATGGFYVASTTVNAGTVSIVFPSQQAGAVHYIWHRVMCPSSTADSMFVSLDGEADAAHIDDACEGAQSGSWQWRKVTDRALGLDVRWARALSSGNHTVMFRGREVGMLLDEIAVTRDPLWNPTAATATPTKTPSNTPTPTPTPTRTPWVVCITVTPTP